ncbi:MAG: hypothetical protein FWG68_08970 [Defluviitaleaceae bacterium]|nr:hypothetical protein [Defluviitaleaceae bacterium]
MTAINYANKISVETKDNQAFIVLHSIDNSRQPVKELRFLLDTGAFITTMQKEMAIKHGFKVTVPNAIEIGGFGGSKIFCDLRVIPTLIFCGYKMQDVIIATPTADKLPITEVVGMNILENFQFGVDFALCELYANARGRYISQKPKYQCGEVSLMDVAGG